MGLSTELSRSFFFFFFCSIWVFYAFDDDNVENKKREIFVYVFHSLKFTKNGIVSFFGNFFLIFDLRDLVAGGFDFSVVGIALSLNLQIGYIEI